VFLAVSPRRAWPWSLRSTSSRSIAPDQQDWMRRRVEELKASMRLLISSAVVGFGRDARLLAPLTDPRLLGHLGNGADGGATNIAGALTAAESLFPADADKRIVLLSDGNETEDSALAELPPCSKMVYDLRRSRRLPRQPSESR